MAEQADLLQQDAREGRLEKFWLPLTLGVAAPLLSGAAYLTGVAYHQAYLNAFRIPLNLLEKSTADYFLYAYMAVAESGMRLLGSGLVVIAAFIFGAYFWQSLRWVDRKTTQSSQLQWLRSRMRMNPLLRLLGNLVLVPTLVIGFSYLAFALFVLFIMPMMFGQAAGARRAAEDAEVYTLGCDKVQPGIRYCNDVFEAGNPTRIASGFIIDSSEKYVAIYESDAVRTIHVEGLRFVAVHKVKAPRRDRDGGG
ncbi:hypothetical protein ABIB38_000679 [Massilia sp. UYP11]|uniref:hypothetical protein n=1 Tax=Massilia sp. UYP11 TaxID=1756385 RepID=UPI003D1C9FA6